jgi:uncharacterized Zn finger protein (UPF0148 family)
MEICKDCPSNSKFHKTLRPDEHCVICGCTLSAKTACLSCACPLCKWDHVMSSKQEEEIKKENEQQINSEENLNGGFH